MAYQSVFKRYELKYLLTPRQKEEILNAMEPYMALDEYGRTAIQNIYYDTDNYRLIRRSLEKPAYKEKLRVRSYGRVRPDEPVFVELKKKYDSVVYKRRLSLAEERASAWLGGASGKKPDSQIGEEVSYFLSYYQNLRPAVFLSYEREAYFSKDGGDLRITFDDNILCRQEELTLCSDAWGAPLLAPGTVLMEVKTPGGLPLWLTHALTRGHICKTSFSKYGTAYQTLIFPHHHHEGVLLYA